MRKIIQFNTFVVVFLITLLAIGLIIKEPTVFAGCHIGPTITIDVDYSGAIDSAITPVELQVGGCLTVEVTGANPPFQLSVDAGYGVSMTQINGSEYEICDTGGACGTVVVDVVDAKGLPYTVEIKSAVGVPVEVECPDGLLQLRQEREKQKSYSTGYACGPTEDNCVVWAPSVGCDANLVCIKGGGTSYDLCRCTVYTCYEWVCEQ